VSADLAPVSITVLTGFPTLFGSLDTEGMVRVALRQGAARLRIVNLRDYTDDRHRTIDDTPYGGGPGMVLKVILLSPQGDPLTQGFLAERARGADLVLICGRYKAVDERVREFVDAELSLGDFVISGGELAAMVIIDGILRLIPGVLGDLDSALGDSFSAGILDCAYYTRPEEFRGRPVPEVLRSGHHAEIEKWRRQDALRRTLERRPELLAQVPLSQDDRQWLTERGWSPEAGDPGRQ
jgi:tRNA (guanine37-N1)-methyltransferase